MKSSNRNTSKSMNSFQGREPNAIDRRRRRLRQRRPGAACSPLMERLEDRIHLSITATLNGSVATFTGDSHGNNLILAASADVLEFSVDNGTTFSEELTTTSGAQTLSMTSAVTIDVDLGTGTNRLTLDDSLMQALLASGGASLTYSGNASDTLVGPDVQSTWTVTGTGAGGADGKLGGGVQFTSVPTLSGSGLGDPLILQGSYSQETFSESGPTAGQVYLDSTTTPSFSYTGLGNITDNSTGQARSLTINTPSAGDAVDLASVGSGVAVVQSTATQGAGFESVTFDDDTVSSLNLNPGQGATSPGTGTATVALGALDSAFKGNISVNPVDQVAFGAVNASAGFYVDSPSNITFGPSITNQQQVATDNWTPNQSYTGVTQASTTGAGTGMTVSIQVGANGAPVATLDSFGTGYDPGDIVTFAPPNGVGSPIEVEVETSPVLQQVSVPTGVMPWTASKKFTNVAMTSTDSSGTGMEATITVDSNGNPSANITAAGTGYAIGDDVTFDPPDGVGTPVTIQVQPVLAAPALTSGFTAWTANQVWTSVAAAASSGAGNGMSATITVDGNGNPTAVVNSVGASLPTPWTRNTVDDGLAQSSTSGSGSGMTANVTVNGAGDPSATIANLGTGYGVGDTVTFAPPDGNGTPVGLVVEPVLSQPAPPRGSTPWTPSESYANIQEASTSGSGTGLGVSVTVNGAGVPDAALLDVGQGYLVGDTITFDPPDGIGSPITLTISGTVVNQLPLTAPGYLVGDTVTFDPPDSVGSPITCAISGVTYNQQLNVGWTPNMDFAGLTPTSTSGSGTGMVADVTTDTQGSPTIVVDSFGTGYQVGDSVTFNPPDSGADSIEGVVASVGTIAQLAGAKWTAAQTWDNVAPSSTSGDGTGMVVNIAVDSQGDPFATLVDLGSGYQNGDVVTFDPPDRVGDPLAVEVSELAPGGPVISTRMVAPGANPITAPSIGPSGPIMLTAPQITLGPGTQLLSWANNNYASGEIFISATNTLTATWEGTLNNTVDPVKIYDVGSGVQLDGATLDGGNVSIFSDASTIKFAEYDVFGPSLTGELAGQQLASMSDPTTTTLTFTNASGSTGSTITRSSGSWISDNFVVGDQLQVIGSQSNDGVLYTIAGVSPQTLTLAAGEYLTDETDTDSATVQQVVTSVLPQNLPTVNFDQDGNELPQSGSGTSTPSTALTEFEELGQQVNVLGTFPVFDGLISHATTSVELLGATSISSMGNVDIESSSTSSRPRFPPPL